MTLAPAQILVWLRANCQRDRVVANALNNLPRSVRVKPAALPGRWVVNVVSRRDVTYRLIVVMNPMGEPERWFRAPDEETT